MTQLTINLSISFQNNFYENLHTIQCDIIGRGKKKTKKNNQRVPILNGHFF